MRQTIGILCFAILIVGCTHAVKCEVPKKKFKEADFSTRYAQLTNRGIHR